MEKRMVDYFREYHHLIFLKELSSRQTRILTSTLTNLNNNINLQILRNRSSLLIIEAAEDRLAEG
jgi:hypothetical protein